MLPKNPSGSGSFQGGEVAGGGVGGGAHSTGRVVERAAGLQRAELGSRSRWGGGCGGGGGGDLAGHVGDIVREVGVGVGVGMVRTLSPEG